jgi:hypothetical protein
METLAPPVNDIESREPTELEPPKNVVIDRTISTLDYADEGRRVFMIGLHVFGISLGLAVLGLVIYEVAGIK